MTSTRSIRRKRGRLTSVAPPLAAPSCDVHDWRFWRQETLVIKEINVWQCSRCGEVRRTLSDLRPNADKCPRPDTP